MALLVRKVYRHGKSLTFSLPGSWDVPDILHVYTNGIYIVYTPIRGLETYYKARYVRKLRRRVAVYRDILGRKRKYYLVTIPKTVAEGMGIRPGEIVFIVATMEYGVRTFIVFTDAVSVESYMKKLVLAEEPT